MKKIVKKSIALVSAITIILMATVVPGFAASATTIVEDGNGNYTVSINDATYNNKFSSDTIPLELSLREKTRTITVVNNSDKTVYIDNATEQKTYWSGDGIPPADEFWAKYAISTIGQISQIMLEPGASYETTATTKIDNSIYDEYDQEAVGGINACYGINLWFHTPSTPVGRYSVEKVWDDNNAADRPESVTVQLYQGANPIEEPVVLSDKNQWKHQWDVVIGEKITVKEIDVPSGYESSLVSQKVPNSDRTAMTLTNKWIGYNVTYDKNTADEVTGIPANGAGVEKGEYVLSTDTLTRTGYTFKGWAVDKESKEAVKTVNVTSDITVYAIWEKDADPQPPVVDPQPPVVDPQPPVVDPQPPVVDPQPPVVDPQPPVVDPQPPVTPGEDEDLPDDNNDTNPPTEDEDTPDDNNNAQPPVNGGSDTDIIENNKSTNDNSDQPKTGDASQMALYIILAGGAAAALCVIARKKTEVK